MTEVRGENTYVVDVVQKSILISALLRKNRRPPPGPEKESLGDFGFWILDWSEGGVELSGSS